jgi:hypothetical protein
MPKVTSKDLDPNTEALPLCLHFNISIYQITALESDTIKSHFISNSYNLNRCSGLEAL